MVSHIPNPYQRGCGYQPKNGVSVWVETRHQGWCEILLRFSFSFLPNIFLLFIPHPHILRGLLNLSGSRGGWSLSPTGGERLLPGTRPRGTRAPGKRPGGAGRRAWGRGEIPDRWYRKSSACLPNSLTFRPKGFLKDSLLFTGGRGWGSKIVMSGPRSLNAKEGRGVRDWPKAGDNRLGI